MSRRKIYTLKNVFQYIPTYRQSEFVDNFSTHAILGFPNAAMSKKIKIYRGKKWVKIFNANRGGSFLHSTFFEHDNGMK